MLKYTELKYDLIAISKINLKIDFEWILNLIYFYICFIIIHYDVTSQIIVWFHFETNRL